MPHVLLETVPVGTKISHRLFMEVMCSCITLIRSLVSGKMNVASTTE
jgi:hypothetical protein